MIQLIKSFTLYQIISQIKINYINMTYQSLIPFSLIKKNTSEYVSGMKELYIHVPVVLIQSNIGYDDRAKNMGKQSMEILGFQDWNAQSFTFIIKLMK